MSRYSMTGRSTMVGAATRGSAAAYNRSNAPRIVEKTADEPREFPIGFISDGDILPADGIVKIERKPQVYFRGERLAIEHAVAIFFNVDDIKVGKDSQLASNDGPLPGDVLTELAVGVRMMLDMAEPGIVVTLFVQNIDPTAPEPVAHPFRASLYGTVLQ